MGWLSPGGAGVLLEPSIPRGGRLDFPPSVTHLLCLDPGSAFSFFFWCEPVLRGGCAIDAAHDCPMGHREL